MMELLFAAAVARITGGPASIDRDGARADGDRSRHADALALVLDLDLGEARFVEQLGKLADEVLV